MGAFLGSVLIAGCYVSQSRQSLYIEQLFVRKDVQYHPDLHVGTALIKYVLQHKEEIESIKEEIRSINEETESGNRKWQFRIIAETAGNFAENRPHCFHFLSQFGILFLEK